MKIKPYVELTWRKHRNITIFGLDLFSIATFDNFDNEKVYSIAVIFLRILKLNFYVEISFRK